jgi:uncharacterized protein (TIGR01244 family)
MGMSIPNWHQVEAGIYSSGQPAPSDWAQLPAAGVRAVVTLRGPEELAGFDEAKAVRDAGLEYYELPVRTVADMSPERVAQFKALVSRLREGGVLVHCGSANRVGAMFALSRASAGVPASEAIAYGRRAGLTGLEPQVAALIASQ